MTIPEQLHLNVLAAPLAAVDRRALSQAWYSALYESKRPTRLSAKGKAVAIPRASSGTMHSAPRTPECDVRSPLAANAKYGKSGALTGVRIERRAAPSPLARKIHRAFARHAGTRATRSATFRFGKRARVHVVLHAAGSRLRLIAFCGRGHAATVTQALAQARYSLAARGLTLQAVVHSVEAR